MLLTAVLLHTQVSLPSCGYKENNALFNLTSVHRLDAHKHANVCIII